MCTRCSNSADARRELIRYWFVVFSLVVDRTSDAMVYGLELRVSVHYCYDQLFRYVLPDNYNTTLRVVYWVLRGYDEQWISFVFSMRPVLVSWFLNGAHGVISIEKVLACTSTCAGENRKLQGHLSDEISFSVCLLQGFVQRPRHICFIIIYYHHVFGL